MIINLLILLLLALVSGAVALILVYALVRVNFVFLPQLINLISHLKRRFSVTNIIILLTILIAVGFLATIGPRRIMSAAESTFTFVRSHLFNSDKDNIGLGQPQAETPQTESPPVVSLQTDKGEQEKSRIGQTAAVTPSVDENTTPRTSAYVARRPAMLSTSILEVVIGLVFVYLLLSLICSAITEIIESFLKNRATDLERGIRELFNQEGGGQLVAAFYNHPLISGLFRGTYPREGDKLLGVLHYLRPTNLPSYIPARNFAYAVIDLVLHPPAQLAIDRDDVAPLRHEDAAAVDAAAFPISMEALRVAIRKNMGDSQVGRALRTLAEQSGDDVNAMRENVEAWFNGSMDRVSGTYKRRTKWIIFGMGFILTVFLNVNTITIAKRLSADATLRSVIVAQAEAFVSNPEAQKANFEANKSQLQGLGLPLGWPPEADFFPTPFRLWDHIFIPLVGWLLTAAAISLGAPFWFDILNKFMVIRATVKPHEKSLEEGSEDSQQRTNLILASLGAAAARPPYQNLSVIGQAPTASLRPEFTSIPEPDFAAPPDAPDNESHLDEGDEPIEDETADEDLPPTKGGVA